MSEPRYHLMPDGRRIAFRAVAGAGPPLVFLPGYMSDMAGSKAAAVFDWATAAGRACLLFDYSGCGASDGAFADGTLSRWRDEALALIAAHTDGTPPLLIGSSMGGWLMLLIGQALPAVAGLVGIAAAPDFTDWGMDAAEKEQLASGATLIRVNRYSPEPTQTHPGFWHNGQTQRQLAAPIPLTCPVRLIHGQADAEVPFTVSLRLAEALQSADVRVTLVKDGEHRLSRPEDIALILATVAALADQLSPSPFISR